MRGEPADTSVFRLRPSAYQDIERRDQVTSMAVLSKILDDCKIKSPRDFENCLQNGRTPGLKIIRGAELEAGYPGFTADDNGVHDEHIALNGAIMDFPQLTFFPQNGLSFVNCIFTGKVNINGRNFTGGSSIEIDNCIFLDALLISGFAKAHEKMLSIFHTNAAYIAMFNVKAAALLLTGCKVFFLSLHEMEAAKFEAENNCFRHFEIEGCHFKEVGFDHRQIDMESFGRRIAKGLNPFRIKEYAQLVSDLNLFVFIPFKTSADIRRSQSYLSILATIDFFKNSTSLSFDRNKYMELIYYEVLLAQDKSWRKAFVRITGGFLKPSRFVIIALLTLLIFAVIYMAPFLEFNIHNIAVSPGLSWRNALYFSGLTFTTIGYGDIAPLGIARLFAVTEGLLGISTTSAFLVALVKKYVD